jgi:polyhydroxyalkanoate synthesis repressor PhaR
MSEGTRIIKRYANRKLYDLQQSSYITHDEIARLVRSGEDVRIIDNVSKEDLTTATLTQIFLDEEKRASRAMPVDAIRNLFHHGGEFLQKKIRRPVESLRDEAERNVKRVLGNMRKDERPTPPPPPEPPSAPASGRTRPADAIREAIEEKWTEFQSTIAQLDYPRRITELERRVSQLEQALITLVGQVIGADATLRELGIGDDEDESPED